VAFTEDDPVEGQIKFNVNRHPAPRALHVHSFKKWKNKVFKIYFYVREKTIIKCQRLRENVRNYY